MKIKGLNGTDYNWKLVGHVPLGDDEQRRSQYHLAARDLLTTLYPLDRVLEEVPLPGSNGLTADFVLPSLKLIVEVHGEQHYKFVPHFHTNILGFFAGKKRDENKRLWCRINNLCLVELPHWESVDEWKRRITNRNRSVADS